MLIQYAAGGLASCQGLRVYVQQATTYARDPSNLTSRARSTGSLMASTNAVSTNKPVKHSNVHAQPVNLLTSTQRKANGCAAWLLTETYDCGTGRSSSIQTPDDPCRTHKHTQSYTWHTTTSTHVARCARQHTLPASLALRLMAATPSLNGT